MAGEMPPLLNLLATESKATYDPHSLAYMRFVIQDSSEADRDSLQRVLAGMKYAKFLKTAYWQIIRANVLGLNPKCQRCRAKDAVHVHHRNYFIHGMEHDHTDCLVGLCGDCHQREHELIEQIPQAVRESQSRRTGSVNNQGALIPIANYIKDIQKLVNGDPT